MSEPVQRQAGFIKALGLWDVVFMNIVAVVGLRWIARGARAGPESVTLWILACLAFFVPLAATVAELASRYPDQGGVYVWVRRAFGLGHGFICGWCLWVNNLFYFPSVLLFGAANIAAMGGDRWNWLATSRWYAVVFVLAGIWIAAGINIIGLRLGKWLQNAGAIGLWIPAALLIGCGALALARFGSATPFSSGTMLPREGALDTLGLWSAMCFAFSGFEITSFVGQEIHNPRRVIPIGVLIGGIVTTIIYIVGSASVLIAVPPSSLKELSGITDAVQLVGSRVGLGGLGVLTVALLALNALAGTASWTAGAARVPFAARVDNVLPSAFARLHPRYRTPRRADRAVARRVGHLSCQRLRRGRRSDDDDPGGVRHPRQPDDPDLLRAVPVSLCRAGAAQTGCSVADAGRDPHSRWHRRSVDRCVRRVRGNGDRARPDVRAAAGRQCDDLRGQPGCPGGSNDWRRADPVSRQRQEAGRASSRDLTPERSNQDLAPRWANQDLTLAQVCRRWRLT